MSDLDKLPPGKYIIDGPTGSVIHADTGEPVSLTKEQQRAIVEQIIRAKVRETQAMYERVGRIFG